MPGCVVQLVAVGIGTNRRCAHCLKRLVVVISLRRAGVRGQVVGGVVAEVGGRLAGDRVLAQLIDGVVLVGRRTRLRVGIRIAGVVGQRLCRSVLSHVVRDIGPARQGGGAGDLCLRSQ